MRWILLAPIVALLGCLVLAVVSVRCASPLRVGSPSDTYVDANDAIASQADDRDEGPAGANDVAWEDDDEDGDDVPAPAREATRLAARPASRSLLEMTPAVPEVRGHDRRAERPPRA
jgi:hypothetical protein